MTTFPMQGPNDNGYTKLLISQSALTHLKEKLVKTSETTGKPQRLRLKIEAGGCSGFRYDFSVESVEPLQEDIVFERDGVQIMIDTASLDLANGSTVDFFEDLMGSMLVLRNPNAVSSCGCGSSFSII